MSEAKRRALALADNKIAENAGWDRELLARELPELAEIWWSKARHRDHRLCAGRDRSADADFEDDPSDPADTVDPGGPTPLGEQAGDLWQLGHHRLLCGDARDADDLARLMGGRRAAMAF